MSRRPTVYLDSTIPSYLVTERKDSIARTWRLLTIAWWETARHRYDLFISEVVLEELGSGTKLERAKSRLQTVTALPLLDLTERVVSAARYYVEEKAMPSRDTRDALHLALASVHSIDFLLTWNFSHLANANKRPHLERLNTRLGLHTPILCSPPELMEP